MARRLQRRGGFPAAVEAVLAGRLDLIDPDDQQAFDALIDAEFFGIDELDSKERDLCGAATSKIPWTARARGYPPGHRGPMSQR